jgi:hypothetical protein
MARSSVPTRLTRRSTSAPTLSDAVVPLPIASSRRMIAGSIERDDIANGSGLVSGVPVLPALA